MIIGEMEICPACGNEVECLVTHHWREIDGSSHSKQVCHRCNALIRSADGSGLLPPWKEQVEFVLRRIEEQNPEPTNLPVGSILKCKKCGHQWKSKVQQPRVCPLCLSSSWSKEYYAADVVLRVHRENEG